jgi:DNA-binding XRE family transcriptional regulator
MSTQSKYAHRNTPGYRIFWHRTRLKMSQQALADHAGIQKQQMQRIEASEALPSFATAILICRALNIDPGWLYDGKVTCKRESDDDTGRP